jgi:hypothetical protein
MDQIPDVLPHDTNNATLIFAEIIQHSFPLPSMGRETVGVELNSFGKRFGISG